MKKILILGVGNAQADFIKFCKQSGYNVYTCSYRNEGRGIWYSDHFEVIDINNTSHIKELMKKKEIDVIYSVGSDIAMPSVAQVSQDLHLTHFVSTKTAKICNNKFQLRGVLKEIDDGIYSVKHTYIKNNQLSENWKIYPAVVKPVDSQGQRGISLIKKPADLEGAINTAAAHSPSRSAIIEEYVDGFEVSINTYMVNGLIKLFFITERQSFEDYPGGIIKSHIFTASKAIDEGNLRLMVKKTADYLNIQNGPIYFQVKIKDTGDPIIIEVTPRLDGCHLWRLIKILYGPDLFQVILKHLSGEKVSDNMFLKRDTGVNKRVKLSFFTQPPETKMNRANFNIDPSALYLEWYYNNGDIIRQINGYQEKVGYQIKVER